jgi:hypothetical protein
MRKLAADTLANLGIPGQLPLPCGVLDLILSSVSFRHSYERRKRASRTR